MKTQLATMVKLTKGAGLPPEPGSAGWGTAGQLAEQHPRAPVSTQCVQDVADPQTVQALQLSPGGDRHSEGGESYTLTTGTMEILTSILVSDGPGLQHTWIDAFSSDYNKRFAQHWTEYDDAMGKQWDQYDKHTLWVNPPFSTWERVATKVMTAAARCVCCVPDWGQDYLHDMLTCAVKKFYIPSGSRIFEHKGRPCGPTKWGVWILVMEGIRQPLPQRSLIIENVTVLPLNKKKGPSSSAKRRARRRRVQG